MRVYQSRPRPRRALSPVKFVIPSWRIRTPDWWTLAPARASWFSASAIPEDCQAIIARIIPRRGTSSSPLDSLDGSVRLEESQAATLIWNGAQLDDDRWRVRAWVSDRATLRLRGMHRMCLCIPRVSFFISRVALVTLTETEEISSVTETQIRTSERASSPSRTRFASRPSGSSRGKTSYESSDVVSYETPSRATVEFPALCARYKYFWPSGGNAFDLLR